MTSSAGGRVTITSRVMKTPMALTGPSPAVEFISASISGQSMPTMTVPALAKIAGAARCSANAIASCRSSWRRTLPCSAPIRSRA